MVDNGNQMNTLEETRAEIGLCRVSILAVYTRSKICKCVYAFKNTVHVEIVGIRHDNNNDHLSLGCFSDFV